MTTNTTITDRDRLRSEWEAQMELRYDVMPSWWWNRQKREAEFEAWLAAQPAQRGA